MLVAFCEAACSKGNGPALHCTDTSHLEPADMQIRLTLAYVDATVEAAKSCAQCQQFIGVPSADACGTCKIIKGPISPRGSCKAFVLKPT
jgi:hypothetical protein